MLQNTLLVRTFLFSCGSLGQSEQVAVSLRCTGVVTCLGFTPTFSTLKFSPLYPYFSASKYIKKMAEFSCWWKGKCDCFLCFAYFNSSHIPVSFWSSVSHGFWLKTNHFSMHILDRSSLPEDLREVSPLLDPCCRQLEDRYCGRRGQKLPSHELRELIECWQWVLRFTEQANHSLWVGNYLSWINISIF